MCRNIRVSDRLSVACFIILIYLVTYFLTYLHFTKRVADPVSSVGSLIRKGVRLIRTETGKNGVTVKKDLKGSFIVVPLVRLGVSQSFLTRNQTGPVTVYSVLYSLTDGCRNEGRGRGEVRGPVPVVKVEGATLGSRATDVRPLPETLPVNSFSVLWLLRSDRGNGGLTLEPV